MAAEKRRIDLPHVYVTGTRIPRVDTDTASPVEVITREDIRRSGTNTLRELIDQLPSSNPSLSDLRGLVEFGAGGTSVSLRNLGKQSTLVLLNSRRVAPYAIADLNEVFTNIDSLPLSAVERIEILKMGASAIYGSDAVAGVINIITRRDFRGLELGVDAEQSTVSHRFGEARATFTAGAGRLASDRANVLAHVELFSRQHVVWSQVLKDINPIALSKIPTGVNRLTNYSIPGNVFTTDPPGSFPIPGCASANLIDGLCRYDEFPRFEAQPRAERASGMLSGRFMFSDTTEGFAEALVSRTRTAYVLPTAQYGIGPSYLWVDPSTNAVRQFFFRGLPVGHPLNPSNAEADVHFSFGEVPRSITATSLNTRLLAGLRGSVAAWDWEGALTLLSSRVDQAQHGAFADSGMKTYIGDPKGSYFDAAPIPLDPDFFNKPGGFRLDQPNSQAVLDAIFPKFGWTGTTRQAVLDGKVNGEIGQLPGGPLALAAGFEWRHERLRIEPSERLRAGDIVGFGMLSADGARSFGAVFAEISAPVTRSLELQAAARLDRFPGFGTHASPKLGLRFQPIKSLLLRGTLEGGFRAPNLTESANSTKVFFNITADPLRCGPATNLAQALRAQADALPDTDPQKSLLNARASQVTSNECSSSFANVIGNNPDLQPEISRSASLGMAFQPTPDMHLSIDYWNIYRKGEIGLKGSDELLSAESALPPGVTIERGSLASDPSFTSAEQATYGVTAGHLALIRNRYQNISRTRTSGFDLAGQARLRTGLGNVDMSALATYLQTYYAYSPLLEAYGNNLAGTYGYPRLRASLNAALTRGNFVNGVAVHYTGPTSLNGDYYDTQWTSDGCPNQGISPADCRVGATTRVDYFFRYTGIKNLTLGAYVRNVLNRFPGVRRPAGLELGQLLASADRRRQASHASPEPGVQVLRARRGFDMLSPNGLGGQVGSPNRLSGQSSNLQPFLSHVRIRAKVGRRAFEDDVAVAHHVAALGNFQGNRELLLHEQD